MTEKLSEQSTQDERLFSSLLLEVRCFEEVLEALQTESVSMEDAAGLIGGIQRDIVQLYRAAEK